MFNDNSDEFSFILKISITNTTLRIGHWLKRKSKEIYARQRFIHEYFMNEHFYRTIFLLCTIFTTVFFNK